MVILLGLGLGSDYLDLCCQALVYLFSLGYLKRLFSDKASLCVCPALLEWCCYSGDRL